jgi:FMN phosphatase YigB (HAD superfamily)
MRMRTATMSEILTAVLDLDGVLGDYLPHLFRFLHARTGCSLDAYEGIKELEHTHRAAGVDRPTYQMLKEEYRSSYKWEMPPVDGMPAATEALKRLGYRVCIATTRATATAGKTHEWLKRNEFSFDGLSVVGPGVMGKYARVGADLGILKEDWKTIVFEDHMGSALAAGRMGWRPTLRNAGHNLWSDLLGTRRALERQYSIRRYDYSAQLIEIAAEFREECDF